MVEASLHPSGEWQEGRWEVVVERRCWPGGSNSFFVDVA
jgi:hypothetical protein